MPACSVRCIGLYPLQSSAPTDLGLTPATAEPAVRRSAAPAMATITAASRPLTRLLGTPSIDTPPWRVEPCRGISSPPPHRTLCDEHYHFSVCRVAGLRAPAARHPCHLGVLGAAAQEGRSGQGVE